MRYTIEQEDGTIQSVEKNALNLAATYISKTIRGIRNELDSKLSVFRGQVVTLLSNKLPYNMQGKRRMPRTRKYPYSVTGELKNSFTYRVAITQGDIKGQTTITATTAFMSQHATLTNNYNAMAEKSAWTGWLDRLNTLPRASEATGGVITVPQIMAEIRANHHNILWENGK